MNQGLRILIVDDDQRMTRTLADILRLAGHEVVEAASAETALEQVRTQTFDCLLTDVRMPGMNGVELHKQLRQERPGLPVLLMTAFSSDELLQRGMDQGVVGVLNKPLDITQMLGFFSSLSKQNTIAIVDDDSAFCKTLGDILIQRGFKVKQITDPHMDIDLMAFDAQTILLDMKLNSISGLDILKSIRERYPDLPVLLLTGHRLEMAEAIEAAFKINAFTCLYKPLEIQELLETLTAIQLNHLRSAVERK
jgi:two-component system, NtrC family, response regulator HydG